MVYVGIHSSFERQTNEHPADVKNISVNLFELLKASFNPMPSNQTRKKLRKKKGKGMEEASEGTAAEGTFPQVKTFDGAHRRRSPQHILSSV